MKSSTSDDDLPRRELSAAEIDRLRCRNSLPVLSAIYCEIASIVGEEAALRLARFLPGEKVSFPKTPRPNSMLSMLLTRQQIEKLHHHFGNDRVKLVSAWNYLNMVDARAMRAEGKSKTHIVRTLRISGSTAEHYLNGQAIGTPDGENIDRIRFHLQCGENLQEVSILTGYGVRCIKEILKSTTAQAALTHQKNRDQQS